MVRARQCARAADRYGTSMRFHIGTKEEKETLIMYAWFHVNVIAQSPATIIWNLSKNLVITRYTSSSRTGLEEWIYRFPPSGFHRKITANITYCNRRIFSSVPSWAVARPVNTRKQLVSDCHARERRCSWAMLSSTEFWRGFDTRKFIWLFSANVPRNAAKPSQDKLHSIKNIHKNTSKFIYIGVFIYMW